MPSNTKAPYGLMPIRTITGGAVHTRSLPLKSGYTTNIYQGQVLLWNGTAGQVIATAVTNPAAKGVVGISAEFYLGAAAATKTSILVYDAADHEYRIQSNGSGTTSNAATYLMKNSALASPTAGNTDSGWSNALFSKSGLVTSLHLMKVVDIDRTVGVNTGSYMHLIVRFNSAYCLNATIV